MHLGEVFERFAAESPVSVTVRVAFERALPTGAVDAPTSTGTDSKAGRGAACGG